MGLVGEIATNVSYNGGMHPHPEPAWKKAMKVVGVAALGVCVVASGIVLAIIVLLSKDGIPGFISRWGQR